MPKATPSAARWSLLCAAVAAFLAAACNQNRDDPTTVHDLRVLAMSAQPPEILISPCDPALLLAVAGAGDGGLPSLDPKTLATLLAVGSRPVELTTLIADPDGGGRPLDYRLLGCASTSLSACVGADGGPSVELARGRTTAGELSLSVVPALAILPGTAGTPLLLDVVQADPYKGLGGIRVPLVLDLTAPGSADHIYAQKLMLYTCQLFPTQVANVNPVLPAPGLSWQGGADAGLEPWPAGEVRTWSGTDPVTLEPADFSALEETYVVPSLTLTPVTLQESWLLNWMTTSGTLGSYQTGGTNLAGATGKQRNTWHPDPHATAGERVTIWVVSRDGRGGESWISRQVDWTP
jgi:hypothetical protein